MSERRGIVIGTGGHVDHGKTALVKALTGVETDRWREERERGLTIDLGFARMALDEEVEVGVVDVPGHEDFLKNMLAGATGIDLLLLVVAADEGPMPQTREHLAIAELLGVERGVVALTKTDKVDAEWLALARDTTRELLEEREGRGAWPLVPVSATAGEGLEELRRTLAAAVREARPRVREDLFRMPVDRAFSIHGTGTVVTGTVWSGSIETGATVRVLPGGAEARVRGLEVHGEPRERVGAGRRSAVALVGPAPAETGRGKVLVAGAGWRPVDRLGVRLAALPRSVRPIEHGQRVRVYLGTREVMAQARLPERAPLPPGASEWAVLALEAPLVARARDRAIVRFYSPVTTIGGARVAELDPPARWQERTAAWERILEGPPPAAFEAALELAGLTGLSVEEAPLRLGLPPGVIEEAAAAVGALRTGDAWFSGRSASEAAARVERTVAELHAADRRASGVSKEAVRSALSGSCAPALLEHALARLLDAGRLAENGPRISLPGHGPELTAEESEARERLRGAIEAGGLQPPVVSDLARSLRLQRPVLDDLLRLLQEEGITRSVTPELHVGAEALDAMIGTVRGLLEGAPPAPPTLFKEEFGLSRKYLIPLLEYLDREGITRRTGEGRTLVG